MIKLLAEIEFEAKNAQTEENMKKYFKENVCGLNLQEVSKFIDSKTGKLLGFRLNLKIQEVIYSFNSVGGLCQFAKNCK